jgi:hypothetical protein
MEIKSRCFVLTALGAVAGLVAIAALTSYAQFGRSKYTSPIANTSAEIAGKQLSVEYYAPSMHGRKVMGGLVPYGEVWCTGANWATKFTTAADLEMGGLKIPAGSYSIWTIPSPKEWVLIINKQTGQYHLYYDSSRDLGRTKMHLRSLASPVETFRIELKSNGGNQGTLALLWERTEASIPFTISP